MNYFGVGLGVGKHSVDYQAIFRGWVFIYHPTSMNSGGREHCRRAAELFQSLARDNYCPGWSVFYGIKLRSLMNFEKDILGLPAQ